MKIIIEIGLYIACNFEEKSNSIIANLEKQFQHNHQNYYALKSKYRKARQIDEVEFEEAIVVYTFVHYLVYFCL